MESGRTWNDNAGIAGGLVWMHGNSGDMDAGGWHAIGGFRARTCQRKERTDERDRRGLWQWIFADCRRNRGIALILPCRGWAGDDRYGPAVLYDGNLWELSVQQEKNRGDQMEQVLQCYGKGIAAGIVLIAVMVLLFAGIRDEQATGELLTS